MPMLLFREHIDAYQHYINDIDFISLMMSQVTIVIYIYSCIQLECESIYICVYK